MKDGSDDAVTGSSRTDGAARASLTAKETFVRCDFAVVAAAGGAVGAAAGGAAAVGAAADGAAEFGAAEGLYRYTCELRAERSRRSRRRHAAEAPSHSAECPSPVTHVKQQIVRVCPVPSSSKH